jgi:uncharacterized protein
MFELLQKHCPVCGMDVDKNTAIKRFGKYFCGEEHASSYVEMKKKRDAEWSGRGGCC